MANIPLSQNRVYCKLNEYDMITDWSNCCMDVKFDPPVLHCSLCLALSIILSALMDLYIHPLYCLVIKILSSILIYPASIRPLYHHLSTVGPLVTLSKYIHVRSSFEEFIETNLMV
jgi:hypothetical protein